MRLADDATVIDQCTIQRFIHFLIHNHAPPTNLIICSSRDAFVQDFLAELQQYAPTTDQQDDHGLSGSRRPSGGQTSHSMSTSTSLLIPTLHLLASSSNVHTSFCPDPTHLLALLSALPHRKPDSRANVPSHASETKSSTTRPMLAILNPVRLHEPTSSFSAQALNRVFASAVEAAHHLRRQLVIVETPGIEQSLSLPEGDDDPARHRPLEPGRGDAVSGARPSSSPWDQQLSILNVTTKTFGVGERAWVGRTVSARQVASRWCRFVLLPPLDH